MSIVFIHKFNIGNYYFESDSNVIIRCLNVDELKFNSVKFIENGKVVLTDELETLTRGNYWGSAMGSSDKNYRN